MFRDKKLDKEEIFYVLYHVINCNNLSALNWDFGFYYLYALNKILKNYQNSPYPVRLLVTRLSSDHGASRRRCPRRCRTADTPSCTPASPPPARTCTARTNWQEDLPSNSVLTLCNAIMWSQDPHT